MDNRGIEILAFISYCLSIVYYVVSIAKISSILGIFIIIIAIIVGGLIIFKFSYIGDVTKLSIDFLLKIKKLRLIKKVFFTIIIFAVVVVIILIIYSSLSTNNAHEPQFVKVADSKIFVLGEEWEIGNGWKLHLNSIDSRSIPRRAFFTIYRNGTIVDDMFLTENEKYMYNNTFIINTSILVGAIYDMVKLTDIYIALESVPALTNAPTTFTNSIGMEFLLIPAREFNMEFNMGSPESEKDRNSDEGRIHRVKISNAFYMGKYEVTQKQWQEIMGNNPSYFKGDNLPVEKVSWNDVQEFIKKLNEKEGTNKYRLPSEAEWEYAARAGTTTRYSFEVCPPGEVRRSEAVIYDNTTYHHIYQNTEYKYPAGEVCRSEAVITGTTTRYSFGDDKLGEYAWYWDNSGSKIHEVGQKKPNPWGLYDIHGNVWEWVQDTYHSSYDGASPDGSAREGNGSDRVVRGGGWNNSAGYLRSAFRGSLDPGNRHIDLGFRLLRNP